MNHTCSLSDPAAALAELRASPGALPWPERRRLARSIAEHLRGEKPAPLLLPLVEILATDSKPEVRQAIANSLHLFDEGTLAKLGAKLSEDSNAFVRKAAERSLDRRRRGHEDAERARRKVEQVQSAYDAIARMHGPAAAEKAQAMAERFADVVVGTTAHNLGGVITSLKLKATSLAQELETDAPDLRQIRSAAHAITDRITFLEQLVSDMTEYARPLSTDRRRERLSAIIDEANRFARDAVGINEAASRDVCVPKVPESITVDIVRHQITIAITNVLKNAYESLTDAEGRLRAGSVTITAKVEGEDAVVIVTDTGRGLEARDLADLREFVPGRTSKKNQGGTGFGLPTARRYVAAHGGSLDIDSELDCGTTVTIRLPLEREEVDPE